MKNGTRMAKKVDPTVEIADVLDYQKSPTPRKLSRLVEEHIGLVRTVAHRYHYRCPGYLEDLIQEGSLGLVKAIQNFDCTKKYKFSSYAVAMIRGYITHYIRDRGAMIRVPRAWDSVRTKFLRMRDDPAVTPEDIQAATGIKVGDQGAAYYALTNMGCRLIEPAYFQSGI